MIIISDHSITSNKGRETDAEMLRCLLRRGRPGEGVLNEDHPVLAHLFMERPDRKEKLLRVILSRRGAVVALKNHYTESLREGPRFIAVKDQIGRHRGLGRKEGRTGSKA
jgi:hypothetical protein